MAATSIRDFFREKTAKAGAGNTIDWKKRKQEWIASIEALYELIVNDYIADSVKDGLVSVSYTDKPIREEYLGSYTVRELVLNVGDERVVFSPKGRNIVGAIGRIDLVGTAGERTLVAQPGRWTIVATRTPVLRTVELNPDSLLEALAGVMGK